MKKTKTKNDLLYCICRSLLTLWVPIGINHCHGFLCIGLFSCENSRQLLSPLSLLYLLGLTHLPLGGQSCGSHSSTPNIEWHSLLFPPRCLATKRNNWPKTLEAELVPTCKSESEPSHSNSLISTLQNKQTSLVCLCNQTTKWFFKQRKFNQ